jgi:hypothetical protein
MSRSVADAGWNALDGDSRGGDKAEEAPAS